MSFHKVKYWNFFMLIIFSSICNLAIQFLVFRSSQNNTVYVFDPWPSASSIVQGWIFAKYHPASSAKQFIGQVQRQAGKRIQDVDWNCDETIRNWAASSIFDCLNKTFHKKQLVCGEKSNNCEFSHKVKSLLTYIIYVYVDKYMQPYISGRRSKILRSCRRLLCKICQN